MIVVGAGFDQPPTFPHLPLAPVPLHATHGLESNRSLLS